MTDYFIADTHFGHSTVIRTCGRPFRSVAEMNAAMIEQWNAAVGPDDRVFHLGDFCFKGSKLAKRILPELQGELVLIRGNHDTEGMMSLSRWSAVHDILEITSQGRRLVLCHYPMLEWPGCFRGAMHLHGHTHGRVPPTSARIDVGVDVWGFAPVALEQIIDRAEAAPRHDPKRFYEAT